MPGLFCLTASRVPSVVRPCRRFAFVRVAHAIACDRQTGLKHQTPNASGYTCWMIEGIHHTQVCCRAEELEAVRAFYVDALGMTETTRPTGTGWGGGGAWLSAGDRSLHIGIENTLEVRQRAQTRHHTAYTVSDLDELAERVEAAGVKVDRELPRIPGINRVQFRDPAGNQVELVQADV